MQHFDAPSQAHLDSPDVTFFVLAVFTATYAGMALGRFPGLRIDRTGIALVAVPISCAWLVNGWWLGRKQEKMVKEPAEVSLGVRFH